MDELRAVDYKAAGTLQRGLDPSGTISRDEFDGLLEAMVRAALISIEDAEYEKDGEVRRFRKVRLTEAALGPRGNARGVADQRRSGGGIWRARHQENRKQEGDDKEGEFISNNGERRFEQNPKERSC